MRRTAVLYIAVIGAAVSFGFFFFLVKSFIGSPSTLSLFLTMYGGFALLGFLVYLLEAFLVTAPQEKEIETNSDFLLVLFLLSLTGTLLVLIDALYTKPLEYYVLISIAAAVIGLQATSANIRPRTVLFQIVALAFLIRMSSFLINPYLLGPDSYWHFNVVSENLAQGYLVEMGGHYYYYPSAHLLPGFLEALIGVYEEVYAVGNIVLSMVAVFMIYLLGKEIAGERAGLISALLLSVSTFHISGSINYAPMVNGFSLVLVSLYILLKFRRPGGLAQYTATWISFWIAALFVFFTHPVTSMSLGLILGANIVAIRAIFKRNIGLTPFYSYAIGFTAYLMFVHISLFTKIVKVIFIEEESSPLPAIEFVVPTARLLLESATSYFGSTLLLFLGTYGMLKWVEKHDINKITLILSVVVLYILPISSFIHGSSGLDPGRLISFVEGLIIVPAAVGFLYLSAKIPHRLRPATLFLFIGAIAFFSTSSYVTWDSNDVYKEESQVPVSYLTQSLVASGAFLKIIPEENKTIYTEHKTLIYLGHPARTVPGLGNDAIDWVWLKGPEALNESGYFLVNVPYFDRDLWAGEKDRLSFMGLLEEKSRVYDSGDIIFYRSRK